MDHADIMLGWRYTETMRIFLGHYTSSVVGDGHATKVQFKVNGTKRDRAKGKKIHVQRKGGQTHGIQNHSLLHKQTGKRR